ncbi:hypothetical protein H6G89_25720 [Oscillatoria sp. FACHB-1407]|uniref:hypothetical protein n=1 Tax=Oscillatoria sp. FACHB-1407 TaxID=2692847 RepID=UPI00168885EA|nr:hypothetical protein [Oscillatoria sp. FACHB-1407]MBD2464409.1 hypothetical protein [Oscillatoria sp. FACHB-1407]
MVVDTKVADKLTERMIHTANSEVEAKQAKTRQLRQNPFTTYRDPETGRWMVIKAAA